MAEEGVGMIVKKIPHKKLIAEKTRSVEPWLPVSWSYAAHETKREAILIV